MIIILASFCCIILLYHLMAFAIITDINISYHNMYIIIIIFLPKVLLFLGVSFIGHEVNFYISFPQ